MLWSSVQLMASAMASTPRQLAAVNCFSGVDKEGREDKEKGTNKAEGGETKKQKTKADRLRQREQNTLYTSIKRCKKPQKQTKQLQVAHTQSPQGFVSA